MYGEYTDTIVSIGVEAYTSPYLVHRLLTVQCRCAVWKSCATIYRNQYPFCSLTTLGKIHKKSQLAKYRNIIYNTRVCKSKYSSLRRYNFNLLLQEPMLPVGGRLTSARVSPWPQCRWCRRRPAGCTDIMCH